MAARLPEVKLIGMASETLLGADVIVCAGRYGQTDANDKGKGKLQECLHGVLLLGWEGISSNLKVKPVTILYLIGVKTQQRPTTKVAGRIKNLHQNEFSESLSTRPPVKSRVRLALYVKRLETLSFP
jgi:hypothetical protein